MSSTEEHAGIVGSADKPVCLHQRQKGQVVSEEELVSCRTCSLTNRVKEEGNRPLSPQEEHMALKWTTLHVTKKHACCLSWPGDNRSHSWKAGYGFTEVKKELCTGQQSKGATRSSRPGGEGLWDSKLLCITFPCDN